MELADMRIVSFVLSFVLMISVAQGETKKNGAFLLDQCRPLASLRGEPDPYTLSKLNPSDVGGMMYCVGFLDALVTSLKMIHSL